MMFATTRLSLILFGLSLLLKYKARRHEAFWQRIKERNFVAQIMTRDEEIGRWFEFQRRHDRSGAGLHAKPDVQADVQERRGRRRAADAADQLARPDQRAEGFRAHGRRAGGPHQLVRPDRDDEPDAPACKIGTRMPDGTMRYCNMTNGGPVFIYVKDGKIIRMTPIDSHRGRRRVVDHRGARA